MSLWNWVSFFCLAHQCSSDWLLGGSRGWTIAFTPLFSNSLCFLGVAVELRLNCQTSRICRLPVSKRNLGVPTYRTGRKRGITCHKQLTYTHTTHPYTCTEQNRGHKGLLSKVLVIDSMIHWIETQSHHKTFFCRLRSETDRSFLFTLIYVLGRVFTPEGWPLSSHNWARRKGSRFYLPLIDFQAFYCIQHEYYFTSTNSRIQCNWITASHEYGF